MKKTLILLGLGLIICSLVADDFMQPTHVAKSIFREGLQIGVRNVNRDQDPAPEYSFIQNGSNEDFTFLTSSYYDYMSFGYTGHNLNLQPEISQPVGYPAGGMYVSYMRSETQATGTDRRAYFSYINSDGTLGQSSAITSDPSIREGYANCAVDPYTGDAFVAWHSVTESDLSYDSNMSYTLFHATGSAGSWRSPFILIDNPEMSIPFTGSEIDEFIWPQFWVGPSPEDGHKRAHAYGNMYPSSNNCLYLYADFDPLDLEAYSDLDWTVQSFPFFDEIEYNGTANVNKDLLVSEVDGQVVFFGSICVVADSLFALYSDDYGATFTKYTQELKQPLENPAYENDPNRFYFENADGSEAEMYIVPTWDLAHYNGAFTDDHSKVVWQAGVTYDSVENMNLVPAQYYPAIVYPKNFSFDIDTGEFSFYDMDIQGADPADDILANGFDLDEDGETDAYVDDPGGELDGMPILTTSAPSWFFIGDYQDAYFHEANNKMVSNGNWLVNVWYDGAKLQEAHFEEPGYDDWVQQPELCISISDDNGDTWSDIRYINGNPLDAVIDSTGHFDGNYAPEFEGMIPTQISLANELEILSNEPGNYHAKLHFVFMDDLDYGSIANPIGGQLWTDNPLYYGALDLEFQGEYITSSDDVTVTPKAELLAQNYPNPFNPTTTIAYNMVEEGNVSIEVFNIKGQKVKTLLNEHMTVGDYTLVWEGTNDNNQKVSSGIYFYKMKSGNYSSTKKMILMK
jgi:hypothetical protein